MQKNPLQSNFSPDTLSRSAVAFFDFPISTVSSLQEGSLSF